MVQLVAAAEQGCHADDKCSFIREAPVIEQGNSAGVCCCQLGSSTLCLHYALCVVHIRRIRQRWLQDGTVIWEEGQDIFQAPVHDWAV